MSIKGFAVYMLFFAVVFAMADACTAFSSGGDRRSTNSPAAVALPATPGDEAAQEQGDLPQTEVIDKSFELGRGARIEVAGIAGPVTVTVAEGNKATVHVVRSGQTREDLDCYRTVVEGDANRIEIRHEQFVKRGRCESIRSRQRVTLAVPRDVELDFSTIAGGVQIGEVEGVVRLSSIAGHVAINGAQSAELSSLAGGLTLQVKSLSARGMRIENVAGSVDLRVGESLDADMVVSNLLGRLVAETPRAKVNKEGDSTYRIRIGAGGAEISLANVTGNVNLRRG